MSLQEQKRIQPQGLQRCPFCHESIEVEQVDVWVCCQQCLARHHTSCWEESGTCATCSHHAALTPQGTGAEVGEAVGEATEPDALDMVRLETAAALKSASPGGHWFTGALAGLASLGVWPILKAERALSSHRAKNRKDAGEIPPLPMQLQDVHRAHQAAFFTNPATTTFRAGFPALVTVIAAVAFALTLGHAIDHSHHFENHLGEVFVSQVFLVLGFLAYLHAYREGVMRHESKQMYSTLVSEGVPAAASKELVEKTRAVWLGRRILDGILNLFCFIPIFGVLLFPLVTARMRGTLETHAAHEELLAKTLERAAFTREVTKGD